MGTGQKHVELEPLQDKFTHVSRTGGLCMTRTTRMKGHAFVSGVCSEKLSHSNMLLSLAQVIPRQSHRKRTVFYRSRTYVAHSNCVSFLARHTIQRNHILSSPNASSLYVSPQKRENLSWVSSPSALLNHASASAPSAGQSPSQKVACARLQSFFSERVCGDRLDA